jgi:isopentenyl-diphosphate delta-isomerase
MNAGQQDGSIQRRKADHIELCAGSEVDFRRKTTLLEQVQLVHDALPDLHFDEIDLSVRLLGKTLRAPLVISAMTGGTEEAAELNRDLARVAERLGIGFGLGSQRAMIVRPELTHTYQVRAGAPTALLLGNLGLVQARQMSTAAIREMLELVGADALCLHLNPAMELVQPGGDRDFRGGQRTIARLRSELPVPLVIKETGCGISRSLGKRLRALDVHAIDVSGAGGTSWVAVETHRAEGKDKMLGDEYWDWGIPTAASIAGLADLDIPLIATGGLRSGLDVASAIALGATVGGLAAPVLRAYKAGGIEGAAEYLTGVIHSIRTAVFLTGSKNLAEFREKPHLVSPTLASWIATLKS